LSNLRFTAAAMRRQLAGEGEDFVEDTRITREALRLIPSTLARATAAALACRM
jgi:hypothetical protein